MLDDGAANVNKTARDEENAARLMAEMLEKLGPRGSAQNSTLYLSPADGLEGCSPDDLFRKAR